MHLAVTQILAGGAAAASQPILLFGTIQISHNRYLATKSARYYDTFAIFRYLSNMIHETLYINCTLIQTLLFLLDINI